MKVKYEKLIANKTELIVLDDVIAAMLLKIKFFGDAW
jgi:hypothetical protein